MAKFRPDPSDNLDYGFDFTKWLDGDTIQTSDWRVEPDDGEIEYGSPSFDDAHTVIWVGGGIADKMYKLFNLITTDDGRSKEVSFQYEPKEV